jgi:hypothetical protein
MDCLFLLSQETLSRISAGLGELPHKFAHPVFVDLSAQADRASKDWPAYVKAVEAHLAAVKADIANSVAPDKPA